GRVRTSNPITAANGHVPIGRRSESTAASTPLVNSALQRAVSIRVTVFQATKKKSDSSRTRNAVDHVHKGSSFSSVQTLDRRQRPTENDNRRTFSASNSRSGASDSATAPVDATTQRNDVNPSTRSPPALK